MSKIVTKNNLKKRIVQLKREKKKIILTSGSWDILHVGHMRYLKSARALGDILIVGVDCDKKIRARKGKDRPIVLEDERMEMLTYLSDVDLVYLKPHTKEKNALIKLVKPDVLVISESTKHDKSKTKEVRPYCKKIVLLKPQAQTSTTARIRTLHIQGRNEIVKTISQELPNILEKYLDR